MLVQYPHIKCEILQIFRIAIAIYHQLCSIVFMHIPRLLDLSTELENRSVFLFGPRQTGKTTWTKNRFPGCARYNLLQGDTFLRLTSSPGRLRQELASVNPSAGPVIIDEIQKLPGLLDDVHDLIESRGFRFVLTGSSPIKLRRAGINLLGGRARTRYLYPFVSAEVPGWDLDRAILYGGIPSVYLSDEPAEDLYEYCGDYLRQEIQAEGLVRGLEPFSRFLHVAAASAAEQVVFERIANDAQVPARTVREFFFILQDTLLGYMLEPISPAKSPKRKSVSRGKFYFFDNGVSNTLAGVSAPARKSTEYGKALEQLVFLELRAWMGYRRDHREMGFWRTQDGAEVDFVIETDLAVEVKSSGTLAPADFKGLRYLSEETPFRRRIIVCHEPLRRTVDGIEVWPVEEFLSGLWGGEFG